MKEDSMKLRLLFCILLFASTAQAAVELNSVTYPDGRNVKIAFDVTPAGPEAAKVSANVRASGTSTSVNLDYHDLQPAMLFSGDISSYVLWAVTPGGQVENLGEVGGSSGSGTLKGSTSNKVFALMITAEPIYTVARPSELVVFTSEASKDVRAPSEAISFDRFVQRQAISVGNPSIRGMKYQGKDAPVLEQARRAVALVERFQADSFAPDSMTQARTALSQAENLFSKNDRGPATDYARRATAYSSEALGKFFQDREAKAEAARRQA